MKYYDWNNTLSYDADVTMVVGGRGIGKTYGARLQFVRDYLKNESRFVELVRNKSDLPGFVNGYFSRIISNNEFPDYIFNAEGGVAYIAKKLSKKEKNKNLKPKWEVMGYFLPLSKAQKVKRNTYDNVKRIMLDEAIIDKRLSPYDRYLPNEVGILASLVDTTSREIPGTPKKKRPRVILLGNAVDLVNPYFQRYKIYEPKFGYTWHDGKTMLLHYVKDDAYAKAKMEDTVAGRMLAGTLDGVISAANTFYMGTEDYVFKKPKHAKFYFGIIYKETQYGVWIDEKEGYYYVNMNIPNNASPIFALTASDNRVNYIMARRMETALKGFIDMYYIGIVRFETQYVKENFIEILNLFGVR